MATILVQLPRQRRHDLGANHDDLLADYARMADLVQTYADFPLGTTRRRHRRRVVRSQRA